MVTDKPMPSEVQSERAILGGLLLESARLADESAAISMMKLSLISVMVTDSAMIASRFLVATSLI